MIEFLNIKSDKRSRVNEYEKYDKILHAFIAPLFARHGGCLTLSLPGQYPSTCNHHEETDKTSGNSYFFFKWYVAK